jgi:hypothetical protein
MLCQKMIATQSTAMGMIPTRLCAAFEAMMDMK